MRVIGVRAHDYGKLPLDKLFTEIAADGWKAVQLAFPKAVEGIDSFSEVTEEHVHAAAGALKTTGLSVAVLGVYIEPSLIDENARRANADTLKSALWQAKTLDAGCVGTETTNMSGQPGVTRSEALNALRKSLSEILPEAERLGVTVALEPVYNHAMNSPELTREIIRDMRSDYLKVIFDPVNLLLPDEVKTQDRLWGRCFDCFGEYIKAVHIKGAANINGVLTDAPFESSVVDYDLLFKGLRELDAPILRELCDPKHACEDIRFLAGLL